MGVLLSLFSTHMNLILDFKATDTVVCEMAKKTVIWAQTNELCFSEAVQSTTLLGWHLLVGFANCWWWMQWQELLSELKLMSFCFSEAVGSSNLCKADLFGHSTKLASVWQNWFLSICVSTGKCGRYIGVGLSAQQASLNKLPGTCLKYLTLPFLFPA
jgi:hypothetical protein